MSQVSLGESGSVSVQSKIRLHNERGWSWLTLTHLTPGKPIDRRLSRLLHRRGVQNGPLDRPVAFAPPGEHEPRGIPGVLPVPEELPSLWSPPFTAIASRTSSGAHPRRVWSS